MSASEADQTLYDAVGGMAFFEALVDRFYDGVAVDPPLRRLYPEPDDAIREMYPRLSPQAAREAAGRLRPSTSPLDSYPLSAPPDVATALIYTTDDEFFPPEWERFVAREVLGVDPIELPGGHFPMLERPEELADLLDRLAPAERP
jgi:pimeloyl-ACP methyl ester carboxylesterase